MHLIFSLLIACGGTEAPNPDQPSPELTTPEVATEVEPEVVDIAAAEGTAEIPYKGEAWLPQPDMPSIDESSAVTTESGLTIISITKGEGESLSAGQMVSMHYHGWLASDGTNFDSSSKRGQTLDFAVGTGRVIRGWDEGILALKVGEKARLRIPSNLGYGARGAPPVIPPGADLVFDVWLVAAE